MEKLVSKPIFLQWYVQLVVLGITLAVYLGTNSPLIAMLLAVEIFGMVVLEVKYGAKEHGWKNEIKDTVIALAIAIIIWYGASFVLNTVSPASAVVSCSMLPNLQRGDFVLVQGAPATSNEMYMTDANVASLSEDATIQYAAKNYTVKGSIFSYCQFIKDDLCTAFFKEPEKFTEQKGPLTFTYSQCQLKTKEGTTPLPCVTSVEDSKKKYVVTNGGDTIVYSPSPNELYALFGDIVHRAFFTIKTPTGKQYYLTKGDNNPILDIQAYDFRYMRGNKPVTPQEFKGKVITRIPYLGYFKLVISGFWTEPEQCRTQLIY